MSELLKYDRYRLRFMLFKASQFQAPVVYPIARLQLPQLSILHFAPADGVTMGPQISDPLLRSVPGIVYVDHVTQYGSPVGNPIRTFTSADTMATAFRQRNRAFRPLRKLDRLEVEQRSVVVYNYSFLSHMVRYATSFRAGWYMWRNVYAEVLQNANKLAKESKRHQFIEMNLPEIMPGLGTLREFTTRQTADVLNNLRDDGSKQIADLFVWAGKLRENSLLNDILPENYGKINFIIRRLNGFVVVNMGWLNNLRKSDDPSVKQKGVTYDPAMFQLMLLKFLTVLHQATAPIETPTKNEVMEDATAEVDTADDLAGIDDAELGVSEDDIHWDNEGELEDDKITIATLEKELEELDEIKRRAAEEAVVYDEDGEKVDTKQIDVSLLATARAAKSSGFPILDKATEMAGKGLVSAGEFRRIERVAGIYATLPDPYGNLDSMAEAIKIPVEDIEIKPTVLGDPKQVTDASLTVSKTDTFERQYIEKVLKKDIIRCVSAIQNAPVAITGYTIDRVTDASNDQEIHTVKVTPAIGEPSTLKFPVPVIKPDGSFLYNGTNYRMRKQRSDLPIRKLGPSKVGLNSYYGKVFVERSERKNFNYEKWFMGQLILKTLDAEDPNINKSMLSMVADYSVDVPRMYTAISERIMSMVCGKFTLWFDHKRRIEKFDYKKEDLAFEKKSWVLVGQDDVKHSLIMDPSNMIYRIKDGNLEEVGSINDLTGIPMDSTTPATSIEVKIYSKNIPIGLALSYLLGFTKLLELLKVRPRRVLAGARLNLEPHEYAIRFVDESLVFSRNDVIPTLILSGFNLVKDSIRNYSSGMFESPDVYSAIFDRSGIGSRYLRELESLDTMFIDPITKDILEWMHEPTTFTGLLVRSTEMLVNAKLEETRKDKDGVVELQERVRGYERIPGMIYEVLSKRVREYSARLSSGRASLKINPNDPITMLIQDPTTSPVNNINPIHALREREVITFGGRGGRSRRAMVKHTRLFKQSDMGFVSEGTVDSGDVGIIAYMPQNANLTTVRGTIRKYDAKTDGATSIMSTPALLGVGADGDDPKRVGFSAIQHGHGIATDHYELPPGRTGMESMIASRSGPEFAQVAKGPGKVTEISERHIAVEYADGEVHRAPLGMLYTNAEGTLYPNTLVTGLKVGDKVEQFDVLSYNQGFFRTSPFNSRRVDYAPGILARVSIREAQYTLEDSCSLSEQFAGRMVTRVTKPKAVQVDFTDSVLNLVKVGQRVDLDTTLCSIEGAVSSAAGLFDDYNLDTLKLFTPASPKAKVVGVVSKIEVLYNGEVEDMSESLQALVAESEKNRRRQARALGEEYSPGVIGRNVRTEGINLEPHRALILVYINAEVPMGIADKLVIGNQMKSVVGAILFGENTTESGERIDIIFGALSAVNRIVTGLFTGGSLNTVVRIIGEEAYKMYFEDAA